MNNMSGRLDSCFRHAPALDDVESAAGRLAMREHEIIWMAEDLHRLRDAISKLDAIGSRVERKLTQ